MAATLGNYYIDGDTLATATAVFDDINLTICAADGFYSDGTTVRQQFNCSLLNAATCPSCNTSCASTITVGGGSGIYDLTFDTGTQLGAMIYTLVLKVYLMVSEFYLMALHTTRLQVLTLDI